MNGIIELDTGGYGSSSDEYDDGCVSLELWLTSKDGTRKLLWESNHYDNDDFERHIEMKVELEEIFTSLGLDISKVANLNESCIYDWEYKECLNLQT
jgi:hypothetical protein